jgi:hypothetical protein
VPRFKPRQQAAGLASTRYVYDTAKRFVIAETNELGHEMFFEHEPGTGTRLATMGPNRAACARRPRRGDDTAGCRDGDV